MKNKIPKIQNHIVYSLFVMLLALVSVGLLIFEVSSDLAEQQIGIIQKIDLVIALIFLADFSLGMSFSANRKKYFKQNWLDLFASIPITGGIYQSLRLLRILRLVRIIRVIARVRRIGSVSESVLLGSSTYIYIATVTATVILSAAVAFYTLEAGINDSINNFFDAIWWAVVTATTVGYGDIYPVTIEGRIIGMLLMFIGIGLVGTVAGAVGSYLLKRRENKPDKPK